MSPFVLWVYMGGLFAFPNRKLGLYRRVTWPFELGERLAEFALKDGQQ